MQKFALHVFTMHRARVPRLPSHSADGGLFPERRRSGGSPGLLLAEASRPCIALSPNQFLSSASPQFTSSSLLPCTTRFPKGFTNFTLVCCRCVANRFTHYQLCRAQPNGNGSGSRLPQNKSRCPERLVDKYNAKVFRVRFEKQEDIVRLQDGRRPGVRLLTTHVSSGAGKERRETNERKGALAPSDHTSVPTCTLPGKKRGKKKERRGTAKTAKTLEKETARRQESVSTVDLGADTLQIRSLIVPCETWQPHAAQIHMMPALRSGQSGFWQSILLG